MTDVPLLRNSERAAFKRCQVRWYWAYRMGLKTTTIPRGPLWFGTGFHIAFAEYYIPGVKRGRDPRETWKEYVGESIKDLVKVRKDDGVIEYEDALELGLAMFDYYLEKYGDDDSWEMLMPEKTFSVLIRDPRTPRERSKVQKLNPLINYVGTFDGVYRNRSTGKIWLLEHKTGQLNEFALAMDDQAGSYLTVAETELKASGLMKPNERIEGIMYNVLEKRKRDERPRDELGRYLNKDGSVSKVQPKDPLWRKPIYRTSAQKQMMVKRIQAEAIQMEPLRADFEALTKNPTRDCGWDCDFVELCQVHEAQGDTEDFIGNVMKSEDPYMDHREGARNSKESLDVYRRHRGKIT